MSAPGHHNSVVLQGTVADLYRAPSGAIAGLILQVEVDDAPSQIPVIWPAKGPWLHRGDLVWLRGTLRAEKFPGARYALVYVAPTHLEVLKTGR
jgi:hypothetical protein